MVLKNNLGSVYRNMGRIAEAEPLLRKAVELNERVLGGSHPQTLSTTVNPVYGECFFTCFQQGL
ncbi:tetratricopeptide repeat protein [Nitrosococcus oceani]|uniref:tetratricopeptide repeat protein n=1 Tax=Nitrosococcus oceani TaxID=1229 RepID=UPI0035269F39